MSVKCKGNLIAEIESDQRMERARCRENLHGGFGERSSRNALCFRRAEA
jgi:hypothetical protein